MGLGQKFGGKNRGKHGKEKKKRQPAQDYGEIEKKNASLEEYYKGNGVMELSEHDDFFAAMRRPLPMSFRVTGFRDEAKVLLDNMKNMHLKDIESLTLQNGKVVTPAEPIEWYPDGLAWRTNLSRTEVRKFPQLAGFHQWMIAEAEAGHITRQELVSMIPTLLMDVKSHHAVLDMCAAPGSKTSQIIEALHMDAGDGKIPKGFCVANDANNQRCYMLVHQAKRLNSPCCLVVNHDAQNMPKMKIRSDDKDDQGNDKFQWLEYDRILADVPCSGDGTLRKNPDVWVTWKYKNTIALHQMQVRIAQRGLEMLKVGGKMVYSTCSMSPIEDEAVVSALLKKCKGSVRLVNIAGQLPGLKYAKGVSKWPVYFKDKFYATYDEAKKSDPEDKTLRETMFTPLDGTDGLNLDYCMRLLPHHADTGGFFVAVLEKVDKLPWQKTTEDMNKYCPAPNYDLNGEGPPAKKKPKTWRRGTFNEDPFIFFEDNDQYLAKMREYYNLEAEFPLEQVFHRLRPEKQQDQSEANMGKARNIFFVTRVLHDILKFNKDTVKFINSGVRIFSRTEAKVDAPYRITQEGVNTMKSFCRKQVAITNSVEDITKLLMEEHPNMEELSDTIKAEFEAKTIPGAFLLKYIPTADSSVKCELAFVGWRGAKSSRLYINKHDRIHFLHLIGVREMPEWLRMQNNTRRQRQANKTDDRDKKEEEKKVENGN